MIPDAMRRCGCAAVDEAIPGAAPPDQALTTPPLLPGGFAENNATERGLPPGWIPREAGVQVLGHGNDGGG